MIPLNYLSASAFQIVRGISCFKTGVSPQKNQINQMFKTSASALREIRLISCSKRARQPSEKSEISVV